MSEAQAEVVCVWCVCVSIRDLLVTRHPDRPTMTVSASPVLGFSGLNKGVGSCIPDREETKLVTRLRFWFHSSE